LSSNYYDHDLEHTSIIAVCISLGSVLLLAFLAVGLYYLITKKKKPLMVPAAASLEEPKHIPEKNTKDQSEEQNVIIPIDDVTTKIVAIDDVAARKIPIEDEATRTIPINDAVARKIPIDDVATTQ
jgi:hypothetical protein